jgi:hypothetical protein
VKQTVTIFERIMGQLTSIIPYIIQLMIPTFRIEYITSEISFVRRVLIVLNACGMYAEVVNAAARNPRTVGNSIIYN